MSDPSKLERRYRRLLAWYPRAFRRENGQEILSVLMVSAPDGRRRPGLAESADLITNGLWLRLRPSVPPSARTVRAAVRLMCAGAAVGTVNLIIAVAFLLAALAEGAKPVIRSSLSEAEFIALLFVFSLVVPVVWLWMARAVGQGRNWARGMSTVLFGLATLELTGATTGQGLNFGVTVFGPIFPALTWLVGAAAVWLLWRPASSAFFKPQRLT
jgi:uncharacterized membrane protein YvlD (DUF360 family)